ncbi:MAG: protein-L-isoaspartate(D-aspartate) O-methyltransferase [Bryobacterales bacterium]|nr:protein-L-isoaspartate(D-aspartate) O-methyltransferase [Bryobacterales bacterium]
MVDEHIAARGVKHPAVLKAMREIPRHVFVPEQYRSDAYADQPLPIGSGQTISQPYIVALMSEMLRPAPDATVLEVGTGSGYQAAILCKLFKKVYSIELLPELSARAQAAIAEVGLKNIEIRVGDGYKGWPEHAPYDRIMLTAAPAEVPQALIDQLAPGGMLLGPVGDDPNYQRLMIMEKSADGKVTESASYPVRFVPMVKGR